ncbi:hypothetical protein EHI8A_037680 [Entamoeba histolytica HM-1:IMSS-B]|uniref:RING-type domain-containing protein n=5 Tax=Entamoeba histolytica TaxID=5759 RepID=C4LWL2_ENTH1|nr:hypothetical protein EHI_069240 [Entamoeba histolytica HM-1:IMSS]EMD43209.1 Hypothetical protein EHI5A_046170 [Entamoeba histolytica KU27]EMH74183.1 hypothetical protein EHI8A_037680 [Entamoeba histolytica HM-1:IMSS-B]ENY62728.1 hypothetical protein EHI7A_028100 [Entamoeba histolytica HM-1:IMSS-A]GAT93101.1 hypothetical protein CL6EHI_069240 [Entamoeba histolytica]EAL49918.1 hypothetical protein EHI_069240 [Entamoeba histolytica HM-1:IMSS]|eukprot:XP_655307.1 hypothetical protein EHI_069240 [Entamoeba histolytica HM-1:IMSS]
MEDQLFSFPITVLPFRYYNIPKEYEYVKNKADDILLIDKKIIIVYSKNEEHVIVNDSKDIYLHGDIDQYHRVVVVTSEGRLIFLREREIKNEKTSYEEFDINFFFPEELRQRKGCKVVGISFYHVESFEIKAVVFTNDKCIFTLSFFTNQIPINAKTKCVYISSSYKESWNGFGAIESMNGIVVVCCTGKEVGRIVFDKLWHGSYESIDKIEYDNKSNKGSVELIKKEGVYDVIWNSSELFNINPHDKEMIYKFNDILSFDQTTNELILKKNSLKPFIKKTEFEEKVFVLNTNGGVEVIDDTNGITTSIRIEGKGRWMINDDKTMWILTDQCLYRIIKRSNEEKEIINLFKLNEIKDEEEARILIHKELDECQVNSKKKIILYCWSIIMDIKSLQKSGIERRKEYIESIKNTLQLSIKMKEGIDYHIIRYIIEMSGLDDLFIEYCHICNDIEGYINYLINKEQDDEVFKEIKSLFNSSSSFNVSNQTMKAQYFLEKYFSILYYRNNDKTVQFLSSVEFCLFPSFFTGLASFKDQKKSIQFAHQLLLKIESKNGFNLDLCEFIFWGMVRYCTDEELLEFMKEKSIRLECVLNLPLKHYFKNHKRSYLFILENKQMTEEMIEVFIELIKEEKKYEDVEKAIELTYSIAIQDKKEDYLIKIFNAFIKSNCDEITVIQLIKKYSIPINLVIDLVPFQWHNKELIELLTTSIETIGNEIERVQNEIDKTIEITNSSFDFNKSLFTCITSHCSLCNEIIKEKEQFVLFACGHIFHPSCIKKEFTNNKTPFALTHQTQVETECPLCGEHQIQLIDLPYFSPSSYWEL